MSAARQPIELIFGERKLKLRPLTIGQVERLEELLAPAIPRDPPMRSTQQAKEAIKIALSRDHAAEDVDELECDISQLPLQLFAIMKLAGFAVGEELAAAGRNASSGETSAEG